MQFVFTVQQGTSGWCVHQGSVPLAEGLTLGQAIKHARRAGLEQHERAGFAVVIELVTPEMSLLLAQYASKAVEAAVAA
jgi:hypothetical protein